MKDGYEVVFITPENRRHNGKHVIDIIVDTAHKLGITRMTRRTDSEGQGADGRVYSAHFFEVADQPVEIMFVLDLALADQLVEQVRQTGASVFFIRRKVEYGQLGAGS